MAKAPLPHSYWLEPGRLLAGEHPSGGSETATADRVRSLQEAGIDCFIDLTEAGELDSYEGHLAAQVRYLRKPIPDHGIPASPAEMQDIIAELERALADGRRVYLHCRAGIGRTNTVAGCWLAARGEGGDDVLEELNRRWRACARAQSWPTVPETEAQVRFVREWIAARAAPKATRAAAAPARDLRDRVRGMLLWLAAGEARSHAVHGLPEGAWADRTAMALCLAESLVARSGHDAQDQVARYQAWQRSGHWSSTGTTVGISKATSRALASAQWSGNPYAGSHDPAHADAEPLARIGPTVAWHLRDPAAAIEAAVNCARVTHQAPLTLDAARLTAALVAGALAGRGRDELLAADFTPAPGAWEPSSLRAPLREIAAGAWRGRKPRQMPRGRFQAAAALESALGAFEAGREPEECVRIAASRPGDAATLAALTGQLAGAHYGAASMPRALRASLARAAEIEALADALVDAAARADAG